MADHYIIDLEEQNEILKKAVQNIAKECDNTNETHETIWRIAYNALQECGLDMVDAGENTLPIQRVSQQRELLLAFSQYMCENFITLDGVTAKGYVDNFIIANNCG